jgi:hypothetical protein
MYRADPWAPRDTYAEQAVYERERSDTFYGSTSNGQIAQLQAAATGRRADSKGPVEFNHAINYVNKIKVLSCVCALTRPASQINLIFTKTSLRSCRLTSANNGRYRRSTVK